MARFFIDRPVFAWVIAILIMMAGGISIFRLPVEQYPRIAPPVLVPMKLPLMRELYFVVVTATAYTEKP